MAECLKTKIEDNYWDYLLETGTKPQSVFKFCKENSINEKEFYEHYSSFEGIEGAYWGSLVSGTVAILEADEDAKTYDAKQRLLAFYFTFLESLLAQRSRFTHGFPSVKDVSDWASLKEFDREFKTFATLVIDQAVDEGSVDDRKKLNDFYPHALLLQFKVILEFYRNDTSSQFADTDAFIEKSVRFFFDGARLPLIESGLDLVRFLVPRLRQN